MADRRAEADEYDDEPRRRNTRGRASPKIVVLAVVGVGSIGVIALVGLAAAAFGVGAFLARPQPAPAPVATAPPQAAAPVEVAAAVPSPPAAPTKGPVATLLPDNDPAADLYGPAPEEGVLSADGRATSPLRPRKGDAVYKVTDLRAEPVGVSPFPRLLLDYERTRDGTLGGAMSLVLRRAGGRDQIIRIGVPTDRVGKIAIGIAPGPFSLNSTMLDDCECYLTLTDHRYRGGFDPVFKVSNSFTAGDVKGGVSLARAWTADEATRLRLPPPEWPAERPAPSATAGVGQDTPFAGDPALNVPTTRHAEAGRPLLGFEWSQGRWAGVTCLAHVHPIYDRDLPRRGVMPGVKREVAKPGYAVGGVIVKAGDLTHAMRVVYFKLTAAGTLDATDTYTTEWLGNTAVAGDTDTKLAGDGRLVIGATLRAGAVLNAISLVTQVPAKK